MCTLIVLYKVYEDRPQIVGMNRDELIARKALAPSLIQRELSICAPTDTQEGGTWIGANEAGLIVAILNRISEAEWIVENPRSRGLICLDALREKSSDNVLAMVKQEIGRHSYNKFTLLCMDAEHAFVARFDGHDNLSWEELDPGLHVLVNYRPEESAPTQSLRRVQERSERRQRKAMGTLHPLPTGAREAIEEMMGLFRDHQEGICQHGAEFGTTSSTIIALGKEPIFLYADGSPCTSAYRDYSHLLKAIKAGQRI